MVPSNILIVGLGICAAALACERPPLQAPSPSASASTVQRTAAPAPIANRCYPRGKPVPLVAPAPDANKRGRYCRALFDKDLRAVEAALRRRYIQHVFPSRVFVSFDCDPFEDAHTIVFESADEREQTLLLLGLFAQDPSGMHFDMVALRLEPGRPALPGIGPNAELREDFSVDAAHEPLGASAFDLEWVRTAMAATIREVALAGFLGGGQGRSGSHHVHRLLRVSSFPLDQSSDGGFLERRYGGLNESNRETDAALLPIELASEPILKALERVQFGEPATKPVQQRLEQSLFASRFQATFANAEPWLRELYLALAARAGEPRLVPAILESALRGPKREQELAIDALAAITGWDRRLNPQGKPRDLASVAADYAAECAR